MGRFINKDPIEEQGGLNLYGFCLNNGVNRWDYLGMDPAYAYNELGSDFVLDPQYGSFDEFIGAIHPTWENHGNSRWYDPATGSGFEFGGTRGGYTEAGSDPIDPSAGWGEYDSLGFMFGVMDRMEGAFQEKKAATADLAKLIGDGVAVLIPNANGTVDVVLAAGASLVSRTGGLLSRVEMDAAFDDATGSSLAQTTPCSAPPPRGNQQWIVPVGNGGLFQGANTQRPGPAPRDLQINAPGAPRHTNPFTGPVTEPVMISGPRGTIPVQPGQYLTGNQSGTYTQVRNPNGQETGLRLDGGHNPANHPWPTSQAPHWHVPNVTPAVGTPAPVIFTIPNVTPPPPPPPPTSPAPRIGGGGSRAS